MYPTPALHALHALPCSIDDTASRRQGWIDGNGYYYTQVIRLLKQQ